MDLYYIRMQHRYNKALIVNEIEAASQSEAEAEAERRFPLYAITGIRIAETNHKHEFRLRVTELLVELCKLHPHPRVKSMAALKQPISKVAVAFYEEIDRQMNRGELDPKRIARAIYDSLTT